MLTSSVPISMIVLVIGQREEAFGAQRGVGGRAAHSGVVAPSGLDPPAETVRPERRRLAPTAEGIALRRHVMKAIGQRRRHIVRAPVQRAVDTRLDAPAFTFLCPGHPKGSSWFRRLRTRSRP
jgi:hypothetical protein